MPLPPALVTMYQSSYRMGSLRSSPAFATLTVAGGIFTVRSSLSLASSELCGGDVGLLTLRQDLFLYGAVLPILPFTLVTRSHVAPHDAQHGVSILIGVYGAGFLCATALCGALPGHQNRQRPVLISLVFLVGGTLMLCFGRPFPVLIVGRLSQGLSGGVVWVQGLALLADVHDAGHVGRAMGLVFTAFAAGYLLAPLLAGILYARAGYYATYGMMLAILGVDVMLWLAVLPPATNRERASASRSGLSIPERATRESGHGTLLWQLVRTPRTYVVGWVVVVTTVPMVVLESTMASFVHDVFRWNAFGAGLAFLPLLAPSLLGGYFIGYIVDRYGTRWPAAAGCVICIPGWILLRLVTHDATSQKVLFCLLLFCAGTGTEAVTVAAMTENRFLCPSSFSMGFAVFSLALGASIQVGGFLSSVLYRSGGWSLVTLIPGLLNGIGLVCVLFAFSGRHIDPSPHGDRECGLSDRVLIATSEAKERGSSTSMLE